MIILGTTTRNKTVGEGGFYCPRCSARSRYRHQAAKRYFTVYFIPLIPLGSVGDLIECTSCGGYFATEMIHYDPAIQRQQMVASIRRMSVAFLIDVNRCRAAELEVLRACYAMWRTRKLRGASFRTAAPLAKWLPNYTTDAAVASHSLQGKRLQ